MPFLKMPKMFRRKPTGTKLEEHKNIGELPSSPSNKKKFKKLSKKEKKAAEKAAKKKGGTFGSPSVKMMAGAGGSTGRPDAPSVSGVSGAASVADRSMNPVVDEVVRRPSFNTSSLSGSHGGRDLSRESNASKYSHPDSHGRTATGGGVLSMQNGNRSDQQQAQASSPGQANSRSQQHASLRGRPRAAGPVDLDDENFETTTDEEFTTDENAYPASAASSNKLSHSQLQQFEMQQRSAPHPHNQLYASSRPEVTRLPNGQLVALDSPARRGTTQPNPASPTYSSDFCLSTDNEDESYNQLRRNARGLPPGPPPGSVLPSALNSPDHSYATETDDEQGTLFANLKGHLTDEEGPSPPGSPDESMDMMLNPLPGAGAGSKPDPSGISLRDAPVDPPDEPGRISIVPMAHETDDDLRAWTPSPEKKSVGGGGGAAGGGGERAPDGGSSAGSNSENRNPNKLVRGASSAKAAAAAAAAAMNASSTSPRFSFAGEDEDNIYGGSAAARGSRSPVGQADNRPPSPVPPGFDAAKAAAAAAAAALQQRNQQLYPDSTDSEFDGPHPVTSGSGDLLPAMRGREDSPSASPPSPPPPPPSQQRSTRERSPVRDLVAKFESKSNYASDAAIGRQQRQNEGASEGAAASSGDAFGDSFANFANFETNFEPFPSVGDGQQDDGFKSSSAFATSADPAPFVDQARSFSPEEMIARSPDPPSSGQEVPQSSASAADPSPLEDLMALQRETKRSKSGRRSRKDPTKSSSSINSAPVITTAYLRQTHKLGSSGKDGASTSSGRRKSSNRGTSDSGARSTTSAGSSSAALAKEKLRQRRKEKERARTANNGTSDDDASDGDRNESWLFDGVAGTLGPRGIAADLESLSGRSNKSKSSTGNKSHRSHRSHRSSKSRRKKRSDASVGSRDSRYSHKSHRSARSNMSHMSEQSRSVANDLLRLEMQLAMVGSQKGGAGAGGDGDRSVGSRRSRNSRGESSSRRTAAVTKRTKVTVVAPPGKLGIILANKTDAKGTVVSGVRTSSVLAEKVSPGDRIIAIDGEDVSRMTVSEITTIMARKAEFERVLTVLTTPKTQRADDFPSQVGGDMASIGGSSITSFSHSYRP